MEGFRKKLYGVCPNENREVVLSDHFAGDNSSLKFRTKFRTKNYVLCNFLVRTLQLPSIRVKLPTSCRICDHAAIQICAVSKETTDLTATRGMLWFDKV